MLKVARGRSAAKQEAGMYVAIVENTRVTHHGQVGVALHEAGARIEVFRPWADGRLPRNPEEHDALVVFGGEQSALDDGLHPYLPDLAQSMRVYGAAERAVLGICLGSQLLARGWGGENRLGVAPEFGWQELRLTHDGRADPVLSAVPGAFLSFQWHSDSFTLPPGAVSLAEGDAVKPQAFRIGRASYGMQFHFEASRAVVADWTRSFPDLAERMSPGWVEDHPRRAVSEGVAADAAGMALARAWVAQI